MKLYYKLYSINKSVQFVLWVSISSWWNSFTRLKYSKKGMIYNFGSTLWYFFFFCFLPLLSLFVLWRRVNLTVLAGLRINKNLRVWPTIGIFTLPPFLVVPLLWGSSSFDWDELKSIFDPFYYSLIHKMNGKIAI